jgi:hypothetical protein
MYQVEADHACSKILDLLGVDKNTIGEVKYKELTEFLNVLTSVHYSKGHDDGFGMCAGYSCK